MEELVKQQPPKGVKGKALPRPREEEETIRGADDSNLLCQYTEPAPAKVYEVEREEDSPGVIKPYPLYSSQEEGFQAAQSPPPKSEARALEEEGRSSAAKRKPRIYASVKS